MALTRQVVPHRPDLGEPLDPTWESPTTSEDVLNYGDLTFWLKNDSGSSRSVTIDHNDDGSESELSTDTSFSLAAGSEAVVGPFHPHHFNARAFGPQPPPLGPGQGRDWEGDYSDYCRLRLSATSGVTALALVDGTIRNPGLGSRTDHYRTSPESHSDAVDTRAVQLTSPRIGTVPSFSAVAATEEFLNHGGTVIAVRNNGGSSTTATFSGGDQFTVPAGEERIGFWLPRRGNLRLSELSDSERENSVSEYRPIKCRGSRGVWDRENQRWEPVKGCYTARARLTFSNTTSVEMAVLWLRGSYFAAGWWL